MPILRSKEIREMSSEDRIKTLNEFRTELVRLKTMIKAGGTIKNTAKIRDLNKTIARILTIEHEQRIGLVREKTKVNKRK